ncbi:hypothetical protein ACHAW6_005836 [Cyclotella cf. meneghiniana]
MINHKQAPHNNRTNMEFMTMIEVEGQLFIDQTGCFPVISNCGYNYIVIFYAVDQVKALYQTPQGIRRSLPSQLHKLDNQTSQNSSTPHQIAIAPTQPNAQSKHGRITS